MMVALLLVSVDHFSAWASDENDQREVDSRGRPRVAMLGIQVPPRQKY